MLLDALEWLFTSPVVWTAVVAVMATGLAYWLVQAVRTELGFFRFMRQHGFRRSPTASTMWLARAVEHITALSVYGRWDGLPVTVNRPRRGGLMVTVTADGDLVSVHSSSRISLGAWTRPEPPALLRGLSLDASGRQLRLHMGDARDLTPYVSAAVAYARALAAQPVSHSGSAKPTDLEYQPVRDG